MKLLCTDYRVEVPKTQDIYKYTGFSKFSFGSKLVGYRVELAASS